MTKINSKNILDVAIYQFATNGYKGASIRNICSTLNINISSISYYFTNKDGLYIEVLKKIVTEINTYLNETIKKYKLIKFPAPNESYILLKEIIKEIIEGICIPKLPFDMVKIYLREYANPSKYFSILENGINNIYMSIISDLFFDINKEKINKDELQIYVFMLVSQIFNLATRKDAVLKLMKRQNYETKDIDILCKVINSSLKI